MNTLTQINRFKITVMIKMQKFKSTALIMALALTAGLVAVSPVMAQDLNAKPVLTSVVAGDVYQGFGDIDALDTSADPMHSRGIVYETAADAQVSAPAAGQVDYAGPVANLGDVVIINLGNNYRVVLTGLSRLSVKTGQHVTSHSHVGTMPDSNDAHLYMELRDGEEPVNPMSAPATTLIAMR